MTNGEKDSLLGQTVLPPEQWQFFSGPFTYTHITYFISLPYKWQFMKKLQETHDHTHSCKCHNKFIYNVWIVLLCRFLAWELGCQHIWNRLKFESELHLVLEEFWSPLPPPQWLIGTYSYSIYVGQYSGFIRVIYMIPLAKIGNLKICGFMELTFWYRDLVDFRSWCFVNTRNFLGGLDSVKWKIHFRFWL